MVKIYLDETNGEPCIVETPIDTINLPKSETMKAIAKEKGFEYMELPKQKHSPLPWNIYNKSDLTSANAHIIINLQGAMSGEDPEADASFILRAVNSHYELVEACKEGWIEIRRLCDNIGVDFDHSFEIIKRMQTAIAKGE